MDDNPAPALARPITDDIRKMRNYPEQPPVIPAFDRQLPAHAENQSLP